ncbi:hypothetical protein Sjap_015397 [Stephania japonica]|uniref:Uncharacterized protein n=1 Tax=Stephania japonica TaxID=461633 RepID=A0AAP0IJI1_9MAGN
MHYTKMVQLLHHFDIKVTKSLFSSPTLYTKSHTKNGPITNFPYIHLKLLFICTKI